MPRAPYSSRENVIIETDVVRPRLNWASVVLCYSPEILFWLQNQQPDYLLDSFFSKISIRLCRLECSSSTFKALHSKKNVSNFCIVVHLFLYVFTTNNQSLFTSFAQVDVKLIPW